MWGAQKADESFETLSVLLLLHIGRQSTLPLCCLHATLATLGIWLCPTLFCEVHLAGTIVAAAVVMRPEAEGDRRYVNMAAAAAALGFAGWALDFGYCDTFGDVLLHAFCWHPLTALALLFGGRAAAGIPAAVGEARPKMS